MDKKNLKILYILVIAFSLLAFAPMSYGYYTFLRIVVSGASAYVAYQGFKTNKNPVFLWWVFSGLAILFNPIIPIKLSADEWEIFNFITAVLFGFLLYKLLK
jgi:hypothetical protein